MTAAVHFPIVRLTPAAFALLAVLALLPSAAQAQRFDVEEYLKRIDNNRNGVLEPDEMSDRVKGWLQKEGFDTGRPVSVRRVVGKLNNDREEREKREAQQNAPALKVPGFGVSETRETVGVSAFGGGAASASSVRADLSKVDSRTREEVEKRTRETMERYDRNRNGVLDADEIRQARWGSPDPKDFDSNKDGRLSQAELTQRYLAREQYNNRDRGRGGDRGGDRGSDRDRSGGGDSNTNDDERRNALQARQRIMGSASSSSSSSRPSTRRSFSRPTTSRTSSSSSAPTQYSASDRAKYEKYADGLISQYDKNKNGALDKDEISEMRRPPKADLDGDGTITKTELIDSLTGKKPASSAPATPVAKTEGESPRPGMRSPRGGFSRSGRDTGGGSSSFQRLDGNEDRRVHMYEFTDDWNQEAVEEFNKKDRNGDGVITLEEWQAGGGE